MSTAASSSRKLPRLGLSTEKGHEILGVALAALVVLLGLSFASYHPRDPSLLYHAAAGSPTRNLVGPFGAHLSALAFALLGLCALLVPLGLCPLAWRLLRGQPEGEVKGRALGLGVTLVAFPPMLQLLVGGIPWRGSEVQAGGTFGALLSDALVDGLHVGGAFVVLLTALSIGLSLAMRTTLRDGMAAWRERGGAAWDRLQLARAQRQRRDREVGARPEKSSSKSTGPSQSKPSASKSPVVRKPAASGSSNRVSSTDTAASAPPPVGMADLRITQRTGEGQFAVRKLAGGTEAVSVDSKPLASPNPSPSPPTPAKPPARKKPAKKRPETQSANASAPLARSVRDEPLPVEMSADELPPLDLLACEPPESAHEESELLELGEKLRTSCEEFGVQGTVEGITPGPVITVFEMQPAPGVKVSRVVGLQDDLALALKAESVRIDRIPGRSTLGVEVPNGKRSVIKLGYLLDNEDFVDAPSPLTMALGVDLNGRPYYADLAKMPHLLVAGATGAGKSVGLQSMITSVLYKATREQVQFIFIDPKRIELGVYADIPHLKAEVVVEPKKAANALRWAVAEMERRYRLLAEVHVRSIAYYNRAVTDPKERKRLALKEEEEGAGEVSYDELEPLPYYVIVIDELADLMMVASSDVETSIARLAQMARAVGIHLIVATQRPSVDVLTGTIKANFPCRLSFATATRHDSRTILDQVGAEKLLGKGDALFIPPGTSRIARLHGAYVTEKETAKLIRWLKRHGKPEIDPDVVKDPEGESNAAGSGGEVDQDPLFDEASRLVVAERQASASFLQRRMRVGFSRAARLVDMMEADGLLGPAQGSKPREVLVPPDWFDEVDQAHDEG